MKFLLDTNIASELRKPNPHGAVAAWYAAYPESDHAIPSIAVYEMQVGIELLRKQNPVKAYEFDAWLDAVVRKATIVPFDSAAARETARLVHGKSLDMLEDAMIAAIAKVNGLVIATRNTSDFNNFDVPQVDPFKHPRS